MARKPKKDKLADQCLSYLQKALSDNVEIVTNAEENFEAYRRDKYGNEVDGRSKFVTSDVADTVEWIMPYLMKLFYGGSSVVEITPTGGSDEMKAKLMNAKVNFDFMQRQNGFILLYDWVKSALLQKLSAVKYCWENKEIRHTKEYEGLSAEELQELITTTPDLDEESVEIVADEEEGTYDLKFDTVEDTGFPRAEVLPPEEFLHSIRSKTDISEADFVAHKKRVHKNYLKSRYKLNDRDLEMTVAEFEDGTSIEETRFQDLGGLFFVTDNADSDFYYIYECFLNDYDSKGNPIPMKATVFGSKVIETEKNSYQRPPFCTLSSIRIPHRVAGMSVTDLMTDLQKLHTSLVRAVMDNVYYQNNGINIVNPFRINLDDVINHKEPGASWRTIDDIDPKTGIFPVPSTPIAPQTMDMLGYIETMREKRSGVSSATTGLDPETLKNNKSGAVGSLMTAAQQKVELIARIMAETGISDLFRQYVQMNLDYLTQPQAVKVDEQWAEISPKDIQGTYDVLVDVGVGTAAKEVQINQWITLIQTAMPQAMELGVVNGENYYNTLSTLYTLMGYKNTDKYCTNPQQDSKMQEQHQQYEQQIQQLQQGIQALQVELQNTKLDKEIDMRKLELERLELQLREKSIELKYDVDKEKNAINVIKGG